MRKIRKNKTKKRGIIMNQVAMFQLTYGLFVLSAKRGEKDNACIVNTVQQVTTTPNRITVAVNKANYTHDMIVETGMMNVSILSEETPFEVFKRFGFQTGATTDKFADCDYYTRAENGLVYLSKYANAYISAKVVASYDLGTHTLFVADVTDADVLSNVPSVTYAYYHKNIKPKPEKTKVKGWRCKICGYVYEGEVLPEDFICPICKHGAFDFERI